MPTAIFPLYRETTLYSSSTLARFVANWCTASIQATFAIVSIAQSGISRAEDIIFRSRVLRGTSSWTMASSVSSRTVFSLKQTLSHFRIAFMMWPFNCLLYNPTVTVKKVNLTRVPLLSKLHIKPFWWHMYAVKTFKDVENIYCHYRTCNRNAYVCLIACSA